MDRASGKTPGPRSAAADLEVLKAARDGDHEAGRTLVQRHGPSMMRTAWSVAGQRSVDAEDVVQEAMIAALTTSALPHGDVGAWLRAIVVRKALDWLRRSSRRAENPLEPEDERRGGGDVSHPAEASYEVLALRRGLARLSPQDRAVLTLVDLEGFSMAEAARTIGSTTVAVKWRAVRARRRLRTILEQPPRPGIARGKSDD